MNEKILDRLEQRPKTDEEIVRLADNIEALIASVELTDEEYMQLMIPGEGSSWKYDQLKLTVEDRTRVAELVRKADGIRKLDGKTAYGLPVAEMLEYFMKRHEGTTGKVLRNKISLNLNDKKKSKAEITIVHCGDIDRFIRSEIVVRVPVSIDFEGVKEPELMRRINALNSHVSCGAIVRDKKGKAVFVGKIPYFYPGNFCSSRTVPSIPEFNLDRYHPASQYSVENRSDLYPPLWDMAVLANRSFEQENVTVNLREPYNEIMATKNGLYRKYGGGNHWGPYYVSAVYDYMKDLVRFVGTETDENFQGEFDLAGMVTPVRTELPDVRLTGTRVPVVCDVVRQEKIWPECLRIKATLPLRMTFDDALKYADALNRKSVTDCLEMGFVTAYHAVDRGDDSTIVCSGCFIARGGMHSSGYRAIGLHEAERAVYAVREIFGEKPIREWEGFKKNRL